MSEDRTIMLKRTRLLFNRMNHTRWLRFFAGKFDAPEVVTGAATDIPPLGEAGALPLPNAPGLWQLADEREERTAVRVMDQNGELYAKVRSLAVPVRNLPGRWTLIG